MRICPPKRYEKVQGRKTKDDMNVLIIVLLVYSIGISSSLDGPQSQAASSVAVNPRLLCYPVHIKEHP
jgi:hypothetical protein